MARTRHRRWLYNRRAELAAASIGTNRYGYAYDTIGNRLWSAANAATNSYTANSLNQYTTVGRAAPSAPDSALVYDADGNLTNDGSFSYSYDAENRLIAAYPLSPVVGSLAVLNRYDHRHRRVQKIVKQYDGTAWGTVETHTLVWDGNNIILEKIVLADGTTRMCEYFWGPDKSGLEQGAGGVGGLLAVSVDGVFYIPCYDHNGNIVRYVSEAGSIAAQYTYDSYGNITDMSGSLATQFSFGFSTKYHDREMGMISYQRRILITAIGRWLNRDTIEEEGGLNLYGFCVNNPISLFDSLGEKILIKEEVIVKDNIGRSSRAFFRPQTSVSFSCSILGVLNISGSASRRIEIISPGQPRWKERHDVYNKNWGSERTDTTEWQAAYAHEMDHWNSFNAFFSFLHMLNEFDGTKLCHLCNEVKEDLERQYNVMRGSAMQHSAKYDTDGFKGGGMYPKAQ